MVEAVEPFVLQREAPVPRLTEWGMCPAVLGGVLERIWVLEDDDRLVAICRGHRGRQVVDERTTLPAVSTVSGTGLIQFVSDMAIVDPTGD